MPDRVDRATMISLRAARTAHHAASEIAYPALPVSQPQPALPIMNEPARLTYRKTTHVDEFRPWQIWLFIIVLLAALTVPYFLAKL